MIIVIHKIRDEEYIVVKRRAASSVEVMRRIVLREVDKYLRPNWSRGFVCNLFLIKTPRSKNYPHDRGALFLFNEHEWARKPSRGFFLEAYINEKSPRTLATDARRLAVVMAHDQRTCGESRLAEVDMLVLQLILRFADLN
jgi:hypothetical protein